MGIWNGSRLQCVYARYTKAKLNEINSSNWVKLYLFDTMINHGKYVMNSIEFFSVWKVSKNWKISDNCKKNSVMTSQWCNFQSAVTF